MIAENKYLETGDSKKNPLKLAQENDFTVVGGGINQTSVSVDNSMILKATKRLFHYLSAKGDDAKRIFLILKEVRAKSKEGFKNTIYQNREKIGAVLKWEKILDVGVSLYIKKTICNAIIMKNISYIFINNIVVNNYIIQQKLAKSEYFVEKSLITLHEN